MFDVIMVSGMGEEAISAVSLVDFINQLVTRVLTALSTGGAIVSSQHLGNKNRRDAEEAAQHLAMLVVLSGSRRDDRGICGKPLAAAGDLWRNRWECHG